jgi:hypothetical protein
MKFVAWFVSGEKVKAVGEYLASLKKPRRADYDRFLPLPVENSA